MAGLFYPAGERELRKLVRDCFVGPLGPGKLPPQSRAAERRVAGLISPHAGLVYSGPVAAHGFLVLSSEAMPRRVVILGPNHRGMGAPLALSGAVEWSTPMGNVKVDREGADRLLARDKTLQIDESAHAPEHSLEVQLPFLQFIYSNGFAILPIVMEWAELEACQSLGRSIAATFSPADTVIIASSDLTHYESEQRARAKDEVALQAIEALDAPGLLAAAEQYGITACGIGPIITMMAACLEWGRPQCRVLRHATSGDVSGDHDRVVGYASVAVSL